MRERVFGKVAPGAALDECTPLASFMDTLSPFLSDQSLAEIYINSEGIALGRTVRKELVDIPLKWCRETITEFIFELAWCSHVRLDPFRPFAGGVVPGWSWRWHAVTPPMSPEGPVVTLRQQRFTEVGLSSFQWENFAAKDVLDWIDRGVSIVIFGATGSGKTTFLVSILREYFQKHRVGIAESVCEIPLLSSHWFRLIETPPDAGGRGGVDSLRVIAEMMRLSPEMLVLGEIRGPEAQLLPEFARTGHGGVMTTLHAGAFSDAQARLESLSTLAVSTMPPLMGIRVGKGQSGMPTVLAKPLNQY